MNVAEMQRSADISPSGAWRFSLTRVWDEARPHCCFIMLNPSTADDTVDDPTVRRCISYADKWGYGGLVVVNLFAFRATDPKEMKASRAPIGPHNDIVILEQARNADIVVCAWGAHGEFLDRGAHVKHMLDDAGVWLYYLKLNKNGQPAHPLYLKAELTPELWA